jgi:AraC-like DNA-binding protein
MFGAMRKGSQPDFFSAQISEAKRFYFDLAPTRSARFAVICGGCEHCAPDYEIHRRNFPFWSVEFVAQGKGTLRLGGRRHVLTPGTLFAYGPGISQRIISDSRERLVKYFVDFAGTQAEPLLRRRGPKPGGVIQTSAPSEIVALFDDLIRNGLRVTPYTQRILAIQVELLALKIAETAIPPGSVETRAFATFARCRHHIESQFATIRTVEEVAAACHVEQAYLCRLFRRFGHDSPYQFLVRLKMNRAADLLLNSGKLVKQVAEELRFADAYHFSRAFKKVHGLSPVQFLRGGRRD